MTLNLTWIWITGRTAALLQRLKCVQLGQTLFKEPVSPEHDPFLPAPDPNERPWQ